MCDSIGGSHSKLWVTGFVEADETYIGGKPRKGNFRDKDIRGGDKSKRGQGTDKRPIIGVMERYGRVIAKPVIGHAINGKLLIRFIRQNVDCTASVLMTDEHGGYHEAPAMIAHARVNHKKQYVDGATHTNSIEAFWAVLRRAWYGQHHHYSDKYIDLYVSEASYKYNSRRNGNAFKDMLGIMVV